MQTTITKPFHIHDGNMYDPSNSVTVAQIYASAARLGAQLERERDNNSSWALKNSAWG